MRFAYMSFKVKVTRPSNAHTSCAISSELQGLRTSNLVYGWRTMTRISHRRHDLQGQGRKVTWSVWAVLAHKSKTNSRCITKIARRVPRDTWYITHQFQGQKVRVTGRLTQTHKMCHIFRTVRPTNLSWCAHGGRRPASAASAMTSKVKRYSMN